MAMRQQVRTNYGASLSPDATAFAHLVDDGGYPRAVQRFLRGWRASSSRDGEVPIAVPRDPGHPFHQRLLVVGATRAPLARAIGRWIDSLEPVRDSP